MQKILKPYLLAVSAPVKVDQQGVRWADPLWAKDLALHLDYIENLTLACPRIFSEPSNGDVNLSREPFSRVNFIDLPRPTSHLQALLMFPRSIAAMWSAVRDNFVVHTGFGGWPISEGLLAAPMARLQRKFLITNVESSFWRSSTAQNPWYNIVRASVIEHLNRLCVAGADLRFFTSKAYLREFLPADATNAYVIPATWIDSSTILDIDTARDDWRRKKKDIRLLFAGRLTTEKGVRVILDAVSRLSVESIAITIVGDGPLRRYCTEFALTRPSRIFVRDPVPYGLPFFSLLRSFDAVVVPSLSDEQPRIVFDAFSQGVPVLGSATGGMQEVVDDGVNGRLVTPGSSEALSDLLAWAARNRSKLETMGLAGLAKSRSFTHRAMHETRCNIIGQALEHQRSAGKD